MVFNKILVAFDGSEHSRKALDAAIELAKKLDSKLVLLTVYSAASPSAPEPELSAGARQQTMTVQNVLDSCRQVLEEVEQKVKAEKIEVTCETAEGNPVEVIVKKSKEGKFDLIVMGARGLSRLKKILVGSVSEGVVKNAACPVLIVK